jgi:hypothetical protein
VADIEWEVEAMKDEQRWDERSDADVFLSLNAKCTTTYQEFDDILKTRKSSKSYLATGNT